ncbi:MAG: MFS transporter [Spirochaetota bacterium]
MLNERKPFDPSRFPFFYGYVIVGASALGMIFSAPGQTVGVSVFTDHLIEALSIPRVTLSAAYMTGTITSAFLISYAGVVVDRMGIRLVAACASVGLGLILVYLSMVDAVSAAISCVLPYVPQAFIAFGAVTFGFVFLRFFGQGMLTLVSRTMLMEWFIRMRGRMNAITSVAVTLVFSGSPVVFDMLIRRFGWSGSWRIMGLGIGMFFTVFILLFFRNKPENVSLLPDGEVSGKTAADVKNGGIEEESATLKEARHTVSFWIYNLSTAMFALVGTAVTFHIVSIFEVEHLGRSVAVSIFLPSSVLGVAANIISGYLCDFTDLKYYLWVLIAALLMMCLGIPFLGDGFGYWMIVIGNGLSGGIFGNLSAVSWPRLFGREHLAAITGFNMSFIVLFSAVGPFLFGLSFSYTGSYTVSALLCAGISLVLLLGAVFRGSAPLQRQAEQNYC